MHNNRKRHYNNKNRNRSRFQNERPSINKVYDSNGPSGRQRGNASTLYEKYINLARDAGASDDRVLSENLMQHAEHYLRIVHMIQEQMQASYQEQAQRDQQVKDEQSPPISEGNTTQAKASEDKVETQKSDNDLHKTQENLNDKPVIRRKSYPFARRKLNDKQLKDSPIDNNIAPDTAEAQNTTIEEAPLLKPAKEDIIPDDTTQNTTEVKPVQKRRVVRKKILSKNEDDVKKSENNSEESSNSDV